MKRKDIENGLAWLGALIVLIGVSAAATTALAAEPTGVEAKAIAIHDAGDATVAPARQANRKAADEAVEAIAIENGFDSLVGALMYVDEELNAGLVELFLNGTDQYTVFAPTNDAFTALNMALGINEISDLPAELVLDVLFYHVVEGRRGANSVVPPVNPRTIETLLGESFSVDSDAMITAIGNTANFIATDISASNGIIHVIDSVILPLD